MNRRCLALVLAVTVVPSVLSGNEPRAAETAEITALIDAAEPGATIEVPAGLYRGPLVVRKSVTLDGSAGAIIDGGGEGTVVEIHAEGVVFRHFTVRASGLRVEREPAGIRAETGPVTIEGNTVVDTLFGIDLRTSPDSVIRGNTIFGKPLEPGRRGDGIRLWWSSGCTVEENRLQQSRDAVFWYSEGLTIRRNHVWDGRYGLHFMYSHDTVVSENVLRDNSVGIYLMYSNAITLRGNRFARNRGTSGYGLGLKDCDGVRCEENEFLANRVGIYIDRSPFSVDGEGLFRGNTIAYNETGMSLTPQTERNVIQGNTFLENEEQATVHGRGDLTGNTFDRDGRGNFWSDYAGFDRDRDGVGDLPYRATSLFEDLLSREPTLRLFAHGPAQQAIEFTARAFPEIRPEPKFVDSAPLMSPVVLARAGDGGPFRESMLVVGLGLLGVGGVAVWLGRPPASPLARRATVCEEVER